MKFARTRHGFSATGVEVGGPQSPPFVHLKKACSMQSNPCGLAQSDSCGMRPPKLVNSHNLRQGCLYPRRSDYCRRFPPADRHAKPIGTAMNQARFRCIGLPGVSS